MTRPQRLLLTREEFIQWVVDHTLHVDARSPYRLLPCDCGDLNCHGWRFVELRAGTVDAPRYGDEESAAW